MSLARANDANRRVFGRPTPVSTAVAFLAGLRDLPSHVLLDPGPRHLEILQGLCEAFDATGDLVPDAQLASIAIEHGAEVVSFDRDFTRFDDLRWSRPG